MTARRVAVSVVVALAVMTRVADADPTDPPAPVNLHIRSPSYLVTDGGSDLRLPPGYFLDEPTRDRLDAEMRRLQELETRLTAENATLSKGVSGWQPGWVSIALTFAGGMALGAYIVHQL